MLLYKQLLPMTFGTTLVVIYLYYSYVIVRVFRQEILMNKDFRHGRMNPVFFCI